MNCASDQRLLFGASPHCSVWLPECPVPVAGYVEYCDGISTVIALSDLAVVEVNRLRVRQYVLSDGDVVTCGPSEIHWQAQPIQEAAEDEGAHHPIDSEAADNSEVPVPTVELPLKPAPARAILDRPLVRPRHGSSASLGRVLGKIASVGAEAATDENTNGAPKDPAQSKSPQIGDREELRRAA